MTLVRAGFMTRIIWPSGSPARPGRVRDRPIAVVESAVQAGVESTWASVCEPVGSGWGAWKDSSREWGPVSPGPLAQLRCRGRPGHARARDLIAMPEAVKPAASEAELSHCHSMVTQLGLNGDSARSPPARAACQ